MKRLAECVFAGVALFAAAAQGGSVDSVVRLLDARVAGSARSHAEAAAEVAADAARGKCLQQYVVMLFARDENAPAAFRLDAQTLADYRAASASRIRALAERTNNPLAWYLVALDAGDTNLLKRASDGGNVQAMNAWGTLCVERASSRGVSANAAERLLAEGTACFKRAAELGDANGNYNLGACLSRGAASADADGQAFACFRKAAEKGHTEAINSIGSFFREGRSVPRDLAAAAKWFKKSADCGNAYGAFNYALALRRGEGVEKDPKAAAEWFRRAADGGCEEAEVAYAVALFKGDGVDANAAEAFRRFRIAAEKGNAAAMDNLAACYARGQGAAADERLSLEWKMRARAARGDRAAQTWLDRLK